MMMVWTEEPCIKAYWLAWDWHAGSVARAFILQSSVFLLLAKLISGLRSQCQFSDKSLGEFHVNFMLYQRASQHTELWTVTQTLSYSVIVWIHHTWAKIITLLDEEEVWPEKLHQPLWVSFLGLITARTFLYNVKDEGENTAPGSFWKCWESTGLEMAGALTMFLRVCAFRLLMWQRTREG